MIAPTGAPAALLKYKVTAFSGVNQHILVGNHAELNFQRTNSFSLSLWAKWTGTGLASVVNKLTNTPPFRGYDIYFISGLVGFTLNSDSQTGNNIDVNSSPVTYNDGRWHHIVATYDGTSAAAGCNIYIDGAPIPLAIADDAAPRQRHHSLVGWSLRKLACALFDEVEAGNLVPRPLRVALVQKRLDRKEYQPVEGIPHDGRVGAVLTTELAVPLWQASPLESGLQRNTGSHVVAQAARAPADVGCHDGPEAAVVPVPEVVTDSFEHAEEVYRGCRGFESGMFACTQKAQGEGINR